MYKRCILYICTYVLLHIHNDMLSAIDKKQVSALILLDMSAAFDTVDHHILLSRLSSNFGITSSALSLLTSYLAIAIARNLFDQRHASSQQNQLNIEALGVLW